MARYARIKDDLSVESYINLDAPEIPQHKTRSDGGLFLRPVVQDDPPQVKQGLQDVNQVTTVHPDRVAITWEIITASREHQVAIVKNEARRRILDRFPDWKQANMTARGAELQDIWRRNGSWTEGEQAEADALTGAWAWIKAVRAASDAIEALEAVPSDFDADERWP